MFLRSILLSVLLLIGAGTVTFGTNFTHIPSAQYVSGNYIVYQWINGVRWAYEYGEDGTLIDCYPDPEV